MPVDRSINGSGALGNRRGACPIRPPCGTGPAPVAFVMLATPMSSAIPVDLDLNMALLAGALAIEAGAGYSDPLYRRIGHPVTWIGWGIERLDRILNRPGWPAFARRLAGVLAIGL